MALGTVVYQQDLFCNTSTKDPFNNLLFGGGGGGGGGYWEPDEEEGGCGFADDLLPTNFDNVFPENSSPMSSQQRSNSPTTNASSDLLLQVPNYREMLEPHYSNMEKSASRVKRRRSRPKKNQEEIERQRMAHIAVERNRRKQMNEYLSVLRGLMPTGYAQKGAQASIVGGAINFVKELEQKLQFLDGQNHMMISNTQNQELGGSITNCSSFSSSSSVPFSEFFNYPQYSTTVVTGSGNGYPINKFLLNNNGSNVGGKPLLLVAPEPSAADVEVTMVESSHANLKVRSKKRPKQLIKLVSGLQVMRLTILHLNVTTSGQTVFYSLSLKIEDDCKLDSAEEIAAAVNKIFIRVREEAAGSVG